MVENHKEKRTYFDCLQNIHNWGNLLTNPVQNSNNATTMMFDDTDIEEICSSMIDNLNNEFADMKPERRATVMIKTFTILIRIYAFDKFNTITSHKQFRQVIKICTEKLDEEISSAESSDYSNYATEMLNLLLMNFNKDNLIVKCLEQFFRKKSVLVTGCVTSDEQPQQIVDAINFTSKMIEFARILSREANIQAAEEFNINYQSLMNSLVEFIDNFFTNYAEYDVFESHKIIIYYCLAFALILTDKMSLVLMFVKARYAEMTIKWLKELSFIHIDKSLGTPIIYIVYNLSRHKKGLKALQDVKAFEILMERKSLITQMNDTDFTEIFNMSLVTLSIGDEAQKQNEDLIVKNSKDLLEGINEALKDENWRYNGCHLSEYLYSLQGAFSNRSTVLHILGDPPNVNKEKIEFFAQLLCSVYGLLFNQDADDLEKLLVKSLLNIILSICNYAQYRNELISHNSLYTLIKALAKQPDQDVAKRIWSYFEKPQDSESSPDKLKKERTPQIYISYNWADQNFCKSFINDLRKCTNLPIWVDYEKMNELQDPWDCLAPAIDSATIIIVLASNAYGQSKSNCQEITYALEKMQRLHEDKSIIIVETVPNLKFNRDWMNTLLDEYDKIPYCDRYDELASQVADHIALLKYKNHSLIRFSFGSSKQSKYCTIM